MAFYTVRNDESLTASSVNDTIALKGDGSTIDGGGGIDTLEVRTAHNDHKIDLTSGVVIRGDQSPTSISNVENVQGSHQNDVISGDEQNNRLTGESGDDVINGNSGNDRIAGGDGHDTINGGTGWDTLHGDAGNDIITDLYGYNTIKGGTGADTITTNSGDIYTGLPIPMRAPLSLKGVGSAKHYKKRPLLFVIFDDMADLFDGASEVARKLTPNLNFYIKHNVQFINGMSNTVICKESRASMLSGLQVWDSQDRFYDEDHVVNDSLPIHLKSQGFKVGSYGKVYNHTQDNNPGLDGWYFNPNQVKGVPGQKYGVIEGGRSEWSRVFSDTQAVDHALDFIDNCQDDEIPALFLGITRPHGPYFAPKESLDFVNSNFSDAAILGVAKRLSGGVGERGEFTAYVKKQLNIKEDVDQATAVTIIRHYLACIHFADTMFGEMYDAFRAKYAGAVTFITSDHGYHLFDHIGRTGKASHYHNCFRIPFLIGGSQPQSGYRKSIVSLVDVYPTICDMVGAEKPNHLQGRSFEFIVRQGDNPAWDNISVGYFFNSIDRGSSFDPYEFFSLTTFSRHYVWHQNGDREIYDHENDPHCLRPIQGNNCEDIKQLEYTAYLPRWRDNVDVEDDTSKVHVTSGVVNLTGTGGTMILDGFKESVAYNLVNNTLKVDGYDLTVYFKSGSDGWKISQ